MYLIKCNRSRRFWKELSVENYSINGVTYIFDVSIFQHLNFQNFDTSIYSNIQI